MLTPGTKHHGFLLVGARPGLIRWRAARCRWFQSNRPTERKPERHQDAGLTPAFSHGIHTVAKCRCTSDDTPVTGGSHLHAELISWAGDAAGMRAHRQRSFKAAVHLCALLQKENQYHVLQVSCSLFLNLWLNVNIVPWASSYPAVDISELRVEKSPKPWGGSCQLWLCVLLPSCSNSIY